MVMASEVSRQDRHRHDTQIHTVHLKKADIHGYLSIIRLSAVQAREMVVIEGFLVLSRTQ